MKVSSIFLVFCQVLVVSASRFSPFDSPDFCLQIITPTCNTTFSYIDGLNSQVRPYITDLVKSPFFRYFKLNLDKQCKFWNAQHFCATRNCAVEVLPTDKYNWSEIPEELTPSQLGLIQRQAVDESATCEDIDYCEIDDDHHCVFVDLLENPERFTGYGGSQSLDVWRAIYSENCFPNTNPMLMTPDSEPEVCVEKNLFYRLISGLHASIAVHLSHEYLDPETETFGPNLKVFMERVGKFNDRLLNIYFNYALVSQAIVKLSEMVELPEFVKENDESCNGDNLAGNDSMDRVQYAKIISTITEELGSETLFEAHLFFDPATVDPALKNEFRSRFRNVSAIMDCVGCDRCRMWGKLQTIGYGTALKVLFDAEDPATQHLLKFRRIELVALFNTFDRLSKSVESINHFKSMYMEHLEDVAAGRVKHGDYEPIHGKGIEFPFMAFLPVSKAEDKIVAPEKRDKPAKGSFAEELENVKDALWFVWRAYADFPKTIYKVALYYADGWWNVFLGKAVYVPSKKTELHDEL